MKEGTRKIYITAHGSKIGLEAESYDCEVKIGDVLDILCGTIAGIYLEAKREGARKEDFANAIRNNILQLLTAEARGNTHCDTK